MAPDARVVEVWARGPDGGWSFGSGYRVGPALVLTAAHVIRPETGTPGTELFVRRLTGDRRWQVRTVWCRLDRRMDAALLEISDPEWEPPPGEPGVRWGVLSGSAPGVPCAASGFPMSQRQDNGLRDTDQLSGSINPGTGVLRHRYEVEVHGTVRARHVAPSPWSGMSGAVVLSGGLVTGLIVEDPRAFRSARVDAVRAVDLLAVDAFRQAVEADTGRPPVLESVELAHLSAPADHPTEVRSPSFLLRADSEVVPFHGREGERAALDAWCREPGFGVRILTGPAGQGKTRLAREIVAGLHRERRLAAWVTYDGPSATAPDHTVLHTLSTPAVLVVDYAETRGDQVRSLIEHALANRHGTAVRLLLLARTCGDWWSRIAKGTSALLEDALRDVRTDELGPLETTAKGRSAAYRRALDAYATALSRIPPHDGTPWHRHVTRLVRTGPGATGPDGTTEAVLALHTRALTDLLQAGPAPVPRRPGDSPEDVLLHHEWRYWSRHAEACGLRLPDRVLDRAVAAAALCAVDTDAKAEQVLRTVLPTAFAGQAATVTAAGRWLRALYPPAGGTVWGSLQPDRIAEHLVGRQITGADDPLFDLLPALGETSLEAALTVLTRAMAHQPRLATVLPALVLTRAEQYAPGALSVAGRTDPPEPLRRALTAVLENGRIPTALALTLFDRLPLTPGPFRRASDLLSARLTRSLVRVEQQHGHAPLAATARTIDAVATRAALAGDYEKAVSTGDTALEYWRAVVAAEDGRRYVPELADACANQAVHLGQVLLHPDALRLAEEAVDLWHTAVDSGQATPPETTPALLTLADAQSRAGRLSDAIESVERAVRIRRDAAGNGSAQDRHALAVALAALAATLLEAGDPERAVDTVDEALLTWETMPGAPADRYAAALLTRAGALTDLARHAEALRTAERAVALFADDATDPADRSRRETLAKVWNALSVCLSELGRDDEAVAAGRTSVAHLYELVRRNPRAHLVNTVSVMANLSHALSEAGDAQEALDMAEKALRLYDEHLHSGAGHTAEISARLLDTLALRLNSAGRHEEALERSAQAVEHGRGLLEADPGRHRPQLSRLLTNQALILVELGRLDDAVRATLESVALARTAALHQDDDATLADLALCVYNAAIDLGEFGRLDEAAALAEEAVGHHRALAGRHPEAFAADLGDSLVVWGRLLRDLGRVEAGRVRLREALELFESGARPESVGETRALLDSLTGHGDPA
ncbi:trypsin-like peptidase domain-containing protein [Streptomyces sp. NPDC013433]|uniref:trypsin-like peptidase domain-containing protein n=1 Tax=Streptomyces sp. NPDC013433 TaxID=3155604 RepID=UPI00345610C0